MPKATKAAATVALTTEATLRERFKNFPTLDILERRLADPRDPGSLPILLKDEPTPHCANTDHWYKHTDSVVRGRKTCPSCHLPFRLWYLRWVTAGEEGRWSTMRAKGYIPVETSELSDHDSIASLHRSDHDTFVRRGDRGQDILAKIPLAFFLEIQRRELAMRKTGQTARKTVSALANEAGKTMGSEAGDVVDGIKVYQDKRHKSTLAEEVGADEA